MNDRHGTRTIWLLAALTVVGAVLRVTSPGRIGLWGDEVQFLNVSALPGYSSILRFLYAHESHPPLYYFIAHFSGDLTGDPLRVMSAIGLASSILLIPAVWWLGWSCGRPATGLVSAALVAVSIPLSMVGVQVRPYALFSLLLVLSVIALLRARVSTGIGWRLTWVIVLMLMLYLHHLAVFLAGFEVLLALLVRAGTETFAVRCRRWMPWVAALLLLAIPAAVMLRHQSRITGYLPVTAPHLLAPLGQFGRLCLTLPAELLLGIVAALVLLPRRAGSRDREGTPAASQGAWLVAMLFLGLCLCLIVMGYWQDVLVSHLVLPFVPLGQVAVGALIVSSVTSGRRRAALGWIQLSVACVTLSTLFCVGILKTNMDLVARYIAAEGRPSDLVLLVPGSFGPGLNQAGQLTASQIDYPEIGGMNVFPFDHFRDRILDSAALRETLDTLDAVRAAGRRVWFIQPAAWAHAERPPGPVINPATAYRARAGLLEHALGTRFVMVSEPISARSRSWDMELMSLTLFQAPVSDSR